MSISIRIFPSDDEALRIAVRSFLACLSTSVPAEKREDVSSVDRHGDWIAYAALILSLPGTALAVSQILEMINSGSERPKLKERIEPALKVVREHNDPVRSVTLTVDDVSIDLGEAKTDDILDTIAILRRRERGDLQ